MLLTVGRIVRPHGIRGDVICEITTDDPDERFVAGSVYRTDPAEAGPLTLEEVRWYQGRLLLGFAGCHDRDAAEKLRKVALCVDSDELDELDDPDEFRDHQLVGLGVRDVSGDDIGTITRIQHGPAQDMLVVSRPDRRQALIPFIRQMVPTVDIAAGVVTVDLPEGLLDL